METLLLTIYVLMWPVLVLVVFGVLLRGYYADWQKARDEGRDMI